MVTIAWLRATWTRRLGRQVASASGVALAVGLLASLGVFLASSKATMTARSIERVAVDWQVEAQAGRDPAEVDAATRALPGVRATSSVDLADVTGFEASTGGTTQTTGAGVAVGWSDDYLRLFPATARSLIGSANGVLLAQQTAANLHASPGDSVSIARPGLPAASVVVEGVIEMPQADSFFQRVGAPAGAQPTAPPDNVIVMPTATWHQLYDPLATSRPDLVHHQLHVRLDHHLPSDPASAYTRVTGRAHNLEAKLAGGGAVGDNLGAALASARTDALYAQLLFLFLGLPGAAVAGLLTAAVAASGADRRRREYALLRARGARTHTLSRLGIAEGLSVGVVGAILGLVLGVAIARAALGSLHLDWSSTASRLWLVGSVAFGVGTAVLAVALPARRDAREVSVTAARRNVVQQATPWWMRHGIDFVMLAAGLVVTWLTSRRGYKLVLAVEGVPALSVSYWAFLGPALLWVGGGLLTWRLTTLLVARGRRPLGALLRPFTGVLSDTVAASMARQRRLIARAAALAAVSVAFAVSTAVFNATYRHQAEVDAVLSNGADVSVTESPGASVGPSAVSTLSAVPGVRSVEAIQHRFAYVGTDLQDLYGVDPTGVVSSLKLQDAYFARGSARELMAKLASQPDSVLVSAETVNDFQLVPGDLLTLRLQNGRTKQYTDVPFHYAGVVNEFPTAPSDSFLVANASYIARATGSDAVGLFLIDAGGNDPVKVAQRVRGVVGPTVAVTDVVSSRKVVRSSLTAVDLTGLTRIELGFAVALVAAATGLVLWLSLGERRRTYAIASVLGASRHQIGGLVWGEAAVVTVIGLGVGLLAGWGMSTVLVRVLRDVFDPPPQTLAVPWGYLAIVAVTAVAAVVAAVELTITLGRRSAVEILRSL